MSTMSREIALEYWGVIVGLADAVTGFQVLRTVPEITAQPDVLAQAVKTEEEIRTLGVMMVKRIRTENPDVFNEKMIEAMQNALKTMSGFGPAPEPNVPGDPSAN